MVNENHNLVNQSEKSVGGVSNNNLGNSPTLICVNSCREKTLLVSSGNTKSQNKSLHQLRGSVPLTVYHQNVRGLRGKANEQLSQLYLTFPHVLCLSEHHMNYLELQQTFLDEKGGVCILVQENLRYVSINLAKYSKDKDFEVCAIKIYLNTKKVCIIAIYIEPHQAILIHLLLN